MRKLAFLVLSVAAVYGLTGCALTDYCTDVACTDRMLNDLGTAKEAFGCASATIDPAGYPQRPIPIVDPNNPAPVGSAGGGNVVLSSQVFTPQAEALYRAKTLANNKCRTNCTFGGGFGGFAVPCGGAIAPGNPGGVTAAEAKIWEDNLATHVFLGEAQVFSPATLKGTYVLSGVKALPQVCDPVLGPIGGTAGTGSAASTLPPGWKTIRINNFFRAATGTFSCVGSAVDGIYGSVEGTTLGDALDGVTPPTAGPGRLAGLDIDSIALDNAPGLGWGGNITAINGDRNSVGGQRIETFSTFWGILGRAYEGRHEFVMPTAGLAEFLSGQEMDVRAPVEGRDVVVRISGEVRPDGMILVSFHNISVDGQSYSPAHALQVAVNRNLRTYEVPAQDRTSLKETAAWAAQNVDLSRPFIFHGRADELGINIQTPIAMRLSDTALAAFGGVQVRGAQRELTTGGRSR